MEAPVGMAEELPDAEVTEEEIAALTAAEAAEKRQRSFERSLAGPSVGKAGEPRLSAVLTSRPDARPEGLAHIKQRES